MRALVTALPDNPQTKGGNDPDRFEPSPAERE